MVLLLVLLAAVLNAQAPMGGLHGRVLDPSGAVLVGAPVVLTSDSGQVIQTTTNRQGVYAIERLSPGPYTLLVAAAGFADSQQAVTVRSGVDEAADVTLALAAQRRDVVVEGGMGDSQPHPAANASATTIKGKNLDALSDDPNELEAQLRALAGPAAGGGGAQIYIDGFTGGSLPPKNAILEIRINRDPYSAEYDALGAGRIEIVTKPGSQTTHGRVLFDGNGSALNSRNPFLSQMSPHHAVFAAGTLGGPLGHKASFTADGEVQFNRDSAAVHAQVLDATLASVAFDQAVAAPRTLVVFSPRLDVQPGHNNTMSLRYRFNDDNEHGNGVGELALASQAFDVRKREHDVQATDLQILGASLTNEVRFELRASSAAQNPVSPAPEVSVFGAFTGGGSNLGTDRTALRHLEVHDYVTASLGAHLLRAGGRLRVTHVSDDSAQDVNGTFTFASLDAFQITQRGQQQGLTPAQIRAAGGGASQFTIVTGQPAVSDTLLDVGLFVQDDWRARPHLTVSGGLRVESQNDIRVHADVAPRVCVAWAFGASKKGAAPPWVLRSGAGLFFDRVPQTLILQARRLDGVHTRQFVIGSPDFFPLVPSGADLAGTQFAPTVYGIDPALSTPATTQTGLTLERRFGTGSTVSAGYLYSHGVNQLLSRNVNAPLPGTLASLPPVYEFESLGSFHQHQFTTNVTLRPASWMSLSGAYTLTSARANTAGAGSFPSNPFDLLADAGRAPFDVRHRLSLFAALDVPGFRLVPFITASSGQPFDITLGRDLNGDSIFNDRPAFATDMTRPGVVATRFGTFDTAPTAGQTIIPRNFGTGPAQVFVNLRAMKPFVVRKRDTIRVDLVVSNLLNRVNAAPPVGDLSSPLFGQSIGLATTLSPNANRQVHVQLQFLF